MGRRENDNAPENDATDALRAAGHTVARRQSEAEYISK